MQLNTNCLTAGILQFIFLITIIDYVTLSFHYNVGAKAVCRSTKPDVFNVIMLMETQ
jgi:hypothetical protein